MMLRDRDTEIMICSIDRCGVPAHFRLFHNIPGKILGHTLLCEYHALRNFESYANDQIASRVALEAAGVVTAAVTCIATFDDTDASAVYLTSEDNCSLIVMTQKLEGWMLCALMTRDARKHRPLTHEVALRIARDLGGTVSEVVIDSEAGDQYWGKLRINRGGAIQTMDVRAIDGIAFALAESIPVRVDSRLILRSNPTAGATIIGALKAAESLFAGVVEL